MQIKLSDVSIHYDIAFGSMSQLNFLATNMKIILVIVLKEYFLQRHLVIILIPNMKVVN